MFDTDELYDENAAANTLEGFLGQALQTEEIPAAFIRIQSSLAGVRDIPVEEGHEHNGVAGYQLAELLNTAQLTYNRDAQFWVGETQVDLDYIVPVGATVTAIGVVKGG